jgi:hypothetical protein
MKENSDIHLIPWHKRTLSELATMESINTAATFRDPDGQAFIRRLLEIEKQHEKEREEFESFKQEAIMLMHTQLNYHDVPPDCVDDERWWEHRREAELFVGDKYTETNAETDLERIKASLGSCDTPHMISDQMHHCFTQSMALGLYTKGKTVGEYDPDEVHRIAQIIVKARKLVQEWFYS